MHQGSFSALADGPFRALHNQDGNAIDDWVDAVAGDADQMRTVKAEIAKAGRAGQLRKQCRIER
jgi:hypothetical protein